MNTQHLQYTLCKFHADSQALYEFIATTTPEQPTLDVSTPTDNLKLTAFHHTMLKPIREALEGKDRAECLQFLRACCFKRTSEDSSDAGQPCLVVNGSPHPNKPA